MSLEIRQMSQLELELMVMREREDRDKHKLTEDNIAPLKRWVEQGIEPGGFLRAVICNDLREATARADRFNRRKLFEYVEWLYNEAPSACWGSETRYNNWIELHAQTTGAENGTDNN